MKTQGCVQCAYVDYQGRRCTDHPHKDENLCFWHDPTADKSGDDICSRIENIAKSGRPLSGFQLKSANLQNICLVSADRSKGYDLTDADLYHADLRDSHLFNINLQGASLLKADARRANLNCANMKNANLLGLRLDEAKIEHIKWGNVVRQAAEGKRLRNADAGREEEICWLNQEAEDVSRNIRRQCDMHGLQEESGDFFQKEMLYRRYQLPLYSRRRFVSKMVDLLCGYGERPIRAMVFSAVMVAFCALLYSIIGVSAGGEIIQVRWELDWMTNLGNLMKCLYFSIVTFTTLGYGDISPVGYGRAVAALEAYLGTFVLALYVVIFVKKMTR
ncbi:MAG: pentapeptide repeat-containing protein [Endozoicomonadaceae bacterium]|nr:pentapeptide repeat-containing protein [Endozoicomonadaceae bacterium]